ncbi:MAG: carboxylating nicotinate-nucleotide diphosphorylase [Chitinispirillaceae bacterium]
MIDEKSEITSILRNALKEDLNDAGDITSEAIFGESDYARAVIRSKESGVLSGAFLIKPLFELVDDSVAVELLSFDGEELEPGKKICTLAGPVKAILAGERTALNLLQKLSGIATATSEMTKMLSDRTCLLDTRKTTPGLRIIEKKAVVHGGGHNHRFGLYDMILIKDTHVKRAGGVKEALGKALRWRGEKSEPRIEIEVQTVDEFMEAASLSPERIMLDNMTPDEIGICVEERNSRDLPVELEVSGNVTPDTLPAIADTGVDFISSGAITHSAPALDIHLVIES